MPTTPGEDFSVAAVKEMEMTKEERGGILKMGDGRRWAAAAERRRMVHRTVVGIIGKIVIIMGDSSNDRACQRCLPSASLRICWIMSYKTRG